MPRYWWFLVSMMAACASGRPEQRPASEAPPPPPASPAQAGTPDAPAAPDATSDLLRKDAQDTLSRTRARLDEAKREQQFARSELDGSRQDLQRAQHQAEAANRSDDALARARAVEAVEAAATRARAAEAHLEYAQRLVAARTADVDAARAHVAVVEVQIAPASDPAHAERVADARRTEEQARSRALELGQAALESQRQWQALARDTATRGPAERAGSPSSMPESGTGSGDTQGTGTGGPAPAPARERAQ